MHAATSAVLAVILCLILSSPVRPQLSVAKSLLVILFRRHADGAIETDAFAIQHGVLANMSDQRRILIGTPEPRWERDLPAQGVLRFLGHRGHHGRLENAWRDGHDANAGGGE